MDLSADPTKIGPYAILGQLGQGSFGAVYRVSDPNGGTLALKWLHSTDSRDPDQRLRFQREVEIASGLSHPNILRILGWGEWMNRPFCTMEVVDGPDLGQVIAERANGADPAWRERVHELGTPLFAAVQHLHNHGIVHRDLKPQNVFVAGGNRPLLGDFGLALRDTADSRRSRIGTVTGTVEYLAPEVLVGEEADRRSDMFSLGVLLFELVTGRLPYPSTDPNVILQTVLSQGPQRLRDTHAGYPRSLDYVLGRLMAVSPDERYFTVAEACYDWVDALAGWLPTAPEAPLLDVQAASCTLMRSAFSGRELEIERLDDCLRRALEGVPTAVLATGEGGIGKTRLMAEWGRRAAVRPKTMIFDDPQGATLGPWLKLVQELLALLPDPSRVPDVDLLERLLAPVPLDSAGDVERLRLHTAFRSLLEESMKWAPLVLVVEDLHLADEESLSLMRFCFESWLTAVRPLPLLTVGTARTASFDPTTILPESAPSDRLVWMKLSPLTTQGREAILRSLLGAGKRPLPPELTSALSREAGGNPAAIREVLGSLVEAEAIRLRRGFWEWSTRAYQGWMSSLETVESGEKVVQVVVRTLHDLDSLTYRALAATVVAGCPVRTADLAAVLELPTGVMFGRICNLLARGLVREDRAETTTRYVARRRAIQAMRQDLEVARTRELHRAWASLLEQSLHDDEREPQERIVRLVEHRAALDELPPVAHFLVQMAERTAQAGGFVRAFQVYDRVLQSARLDAVFTPTALFNLSIRRAELAELAGEIGRAAVLLDELLRTATARTRQRLLDRMARCQFALGNHSIAVDYWVTLLRELGIWMPSGTLGWMALPWGLVKQGEALRRQLGQAETVVSTCAGLMRADYLNPNPRHRTSVFYVLLTVSRLARLTREPSHLAQSHAIQAIVYTIRLPRASWRRFHHRAAVRNLEGSPPRVRVEVQWMLAYLQLLSGEFSAGIELASAATAEARRCGDISGLCYALNILNFGLTIVGDLQRSEAVLREARPIVSALGDSRISLAFWNQDLWAHLMTGNLDGARRLADSLSRPERSRFQGATPFLPFDSADRMYRIGAAMVLMGRLAPAQELLEEALAELQRLKSGHHWYVQVAYWLSQALSRRLMERPEAARSPARRRRLAALAGQVGRLSDGFPHLQGLADAVRAEWLSHRSPSEALQLFDKAVAAMDLAGMRLMTSFVRESAARVALRVPGERSARAQAAIEAWEAFGAPQHAERIRREH